MDGDGTAVRAYRIYGIILAFGGIGLAGLSFVFSPTPLAVGIAALAPVVWVLHRRKDPLINLGIPVLMVGVLVLVAETAEGRIFDWVGTLEVAAFVVVCGISQVALAPWLARHRMKII